MLEDDIPGIFFAEPEGLSCHPLPIRKFICIFFGVPNNRSVSKNIGCFVCVRTDMSYGAISLLG